MARLETFGEKLARFRLGTDLSQRQLGLKAGLAQQTVNLLERDLREPSLRTIVLLAEALEVDAGEFFRNLKL